MQSRISNTGKNAMIDQTFDQTTTGCLSVVISAIVGFHLLIPLMAVFDAVDWPIFHSGDLAWLNHCCVAGIRSHGLGRVA
jgi:hypothetical protein